MKKRKIAHWESTCERCGGTRKFDIFMGSGKNVTFKNIGGTWKFKIFMKFWKNVIFEKFRRTQNFGKKLDIQKIIRGKSEIFMKFRALGNPRLS